MVIDPWQIATGLMAMITGMVCYIANAQVARINNHAMMLVDHGDRLTRAEERMLTREGLKAELREVENRLTEAIHGHARHQAEVTARVDAKADTALVKIEELRRDISGA